MPNTTASAFLQYSLGSTLGLTRTFSVNDATLTKDFIDLAYTSPALSTNIKVDLCDVTTIKIVFIETDMPVTLIFDTTTVVPILVNSFFMLITNVPVTATTGLYVTNPNINPATLQITVLGV